MRYTVAMFLAVCVMFLAFAPAHAEKKSQVLDQYTQTTTYVVEKGDWLSKIAAKHDLKVKRLAEINEIDDPDRIYPGQELVIPVQVQGKEQSAPKQEKKKQEETRPQQKIIEIEEESQTYTVQSGDTVWGISQKFDVSQADLVKANDISDPSSIREGEELVISDELEKEEVQRDTPIGGEETSGGVFQWRDPGADPFTDDPQDPENIQQALGLLGFSQDEVADISSEVQDASGQKSYIQKGDKLAAMVFGDGRVEKPVVAAFDDKQPVKVYTTATLDRLGYALVVPEACGNFSLIRKTPKIEEPKKEVEAEEPPPPAEPETGPPSVSGTFPSSEGDGPSFPEVPTHPGTPGENGEEGTEQTKFDAYMGGGYSEPAHGSGHDQHAWGKARYRPLWAEIGSMDVGIGGFVYGAMGSGEDGEYGYDWNKVAIGPNVKVMGEHWDADLDLGVGIMSNEGEEGKYQGEQEDDFWYVSSSTSFYKRRNEGKQWLPESNFGIEATIPFNTDHDHSWDRNELSPDPWDNQQVEFSYKQGIYDFNLNGVRFTPEAHAGVGHSWGQEADFYKIGPGMSAAYKGYDIFTLSANYQEYMGSDADSWNWFSLTLDVGNAYRAWKASRIEKVN